jgi:hypothetical protein
VFVLYGAGDATKEANMTIKGTTFYVCEDDQEQQHNNRLM